MTRHGIYGARAWLARAALAATLHAAPASAHTSPDWDEIEAEIRSFPSEQGAISQQVSDELHRNEPLTQGAPTSWTIVFRKGDGSNRHIDSNFRIASWTRRSGGDVEELINYGRRNESVQTDSLNLVDWPIGRLAMLSLSGPISTATDFNVELKYRGLRDPQNFAVGDSDVVQVEDKNCSFVGSAATLVTGRCMESWHHSFYKYEYDDGNYDENPTTPISVDMVLKFHPDFGIFINTEQWNDAIDWKIGDQPWHSQQLSSRLTPAQSQQARALFVRGFDLYKGGDFVGALALIKGGQAIDPGNHLGWFTLAEISRSQVALQAGSTSTAAQDLEDAEAIYYQHTIDLAPDSPEAILAKSYLSK